MVTIDIDEEVFNYLKALAEPFVDTPNTVLRRILLQNQQATNKPQLIMSTKVGSMMLPSKDSEAKSEVFMSSFLQYRYKEKFRTKSPYRTMFESDSYLIYFQNFNKAGSGNLWYRLSESSVKVLRKSSKLALVCFTNPAESIVYEIPMNDIDSQAKKANWQKDFFEVNIDPATSRWRDIDWNIGKYLVSINKCETEVKP